MKITAVTPFAAWVGTRNQLLVKVETDEGIFGWGEGGLSGREKAVAGAVEHYARVSRRPRPLRDRRALAGDVPQPVFRGRPGARRPRSPPSTSRCTTSRARRSACRSTSCSAASSATAIPTFATTRAAPGPEMIEQAQALAAAGWTAIRFFPGRPGQPRPLRAARVASAATAKWCARAREALGDDVVLGIDYHHRLSVAEAASFCQQMPRGTLDFLEEPIRDETPEAYEALRTDDRRALRDRRGVRLANGSSCPTSSAASTSSTASTSATSAA